MKQKFWWGLWSVFAAIFLLAACAEQPAQPNPTATSPISQELETRTPDPTQIKTIEPTLVPTVTEILTSTPLAPSPTRQVDTSSLATQKALDDFATKTIGFPEICSSVLVSSLSPNGEWLATSCKNQWNYVLQIANREGQQWELQPKDYVAEKDKEPDGSVFSAGLDPKYWSVDGSYLYFVSHISLDGGGTCLYRFGAQGLYRIRLKDGHVSTILPAKSISSGGWPEIEFSPTGRRLAYQGSGESVIRDLVTGQETIINIDKDLEVGNFTWSPDGLELAYSTCRANQDYSAVETSSIKIFSVRQNESRTILNADKKFLTIQNWSNDDILTLGEEYETGYQNTIFFTLSSGQVIIATPTPD